jgi:hypothetical protein
MFLLKFFLVAIVVKTVLQFAGGHVRDCFSIEPWRSCPRHCLWDFPGGQILEIELLQGFNSGGHVLDRLLMR